MADRPQGRPESRRVSPVNRTVGSGSHQGFTIHGSRSDERRPVEAFTAVAAAIEGGTVVATDNESAITCSLQPTSLRNRHFCLNVEFVRDKVQMEEIRVHWVDGDENPADLYTKSSISATKFKQLAKMVLGEVILPTPKVFIR